MPFLQPEKLIPQDRCFDTPKKWRNTVRNQKGFSFVRFIFSGGLIVFVVVMAMKIVPLYIAHNHLKKAIDDVNNDRSLIGANPKTVMESLSKRASINNISYAEDSIELSYDSERHPTLSTTYDKIIPLAGNVKLELHFETDPSSLEEYNPLAGATAAKDQINSAFKEQSKILNSF